MFQNGNKTNETETKSSSCFVPKLIGYQIVFLKKIPLYNEEYYIDNKLS